MSNAKSEHLTVEQLLMMAFNAVWGTHDDRGMALGQLADALEEHGLNEQAALARKRHSVYTVKGNITTICGEFTSFVEVEGLPRAEALKSLIEDCTYATQSEAKAFMDAMNEHDGWSEVLSSYEEEELIEQLKEILDIEDEEEDEEDDE